MFINIFKMQNTYSVHVEYKTIPFCPCNTTTLPDGMFSISICILIIEIEIYLDAALSPYWTFILLVKHSH